MVEVQIARRGVRDARVLDAMRKVPRETFVPEDLREFAFDDAPLPIDAGQTISQPYIVAVMAEAAHIGPEDRVLEIGAGSGYASAILGRLAHRVYAIERHQALADSARTRLERLRATNVRLVCGDGTGGLADEAPFDAIVVSAGGPEVPKPLLEQLAVGGRLIMPVGEAMRLQELVRIVRTSEDHYERESLGQVQFVPLVGSEGWSADGTPLPHHRAPKPLRLRSSQRERLATLVSEHCEPIEDLERSSLDPLISRLADAKVVLLGEATHGTSEFYRLRSRITRELIEHHGFLAVCLEADWPDAAALDRRVRGGAERPLREPAFSRFPRWMWRNAETEAFVSWLADRNHGLESNGLRTSMHGLDLYSLDNSIGSVLDFLERVAPRAAEAARVRYSCFSPWERDPQTYGRAVSSGRMEACEDEAVATLEDLLEQRLEHIAIDAEGWFDATRNATVIREADRYYRAMYRSAAESWNLRDRHMMETLEAILEHRGPGARAVVWAHNSHVGDASATEFARRGETNLGELARTKWSDAARLVGFGTHTGRVAAAATWGDPVRFMTVTPSHEDSYERICHDSELRSFCLSLRRCPSEDLKMQLEAPRLVRAIGVVYRPETELLSHYFQSSLPRQFDEFLWIDETTPVTPLPSPIAAGDPETYPFGL